MKIFDPKLTGSIEIQNTITGNVTIAGGLTVEGSLGGGITGSATASYVEYSNIANKPTLLSGSSQIASDISGSFTSLSSSLASELLKNTTDTLTGDLTVTGTITAQEFHTEFVSASIIYESGSTQFGNSNDDRHLFTGRIGIGTSDPQEELDIASAGPGIQLTDTDGGTARIINLGTDLVIQTDRDNLVDTSTIQFEVDGTEHMRIHTGGNVGIGTITPAEKLEIAKDDISSGGARIRLTNLHNGADWGVNTILGGIDFYNPDTSRTGFTAGIDVIQDTATSTYPAYTAMVFKTRNVDVTEQMRLNHDGNLGIGTNVADSKLHIYGTTPTLEIDNNGAEEFKIIAGFSDLGTFLQSYNRSTSAYEKITVRGSQFEYRGASSATELIVSSSGDVGIGTDSPNEKLTVNGNIESLDTFILRNSGGHRYQQLFQNTNDFVIRYNNTSSWLERMRIDSSGNLQVGAGDISAAGVIHAYRSSALADLVLQSAGGSGRAWRFISDTDGKFYIRDNNAASNRLYIDTNGNVGIGANTPGQKLHVEGALRLTSNPSVTGDGSSAQFWNQSGVGPTIAGNAFQVQINGTTPALHIKNDGNVGIGTTSPTTKFEIRDNASAVNENYVNFQRRTGSQSSYDATGFSINAIPTNNTGKTGISYLELQGRYSALNGSHGTSAFMALTPGIGTTYGNGNIDFFIRNNTAPYTFKNDPATSSTYWMNPVMTIRSNGGITFNGDTADANALDDYEEGTFSTTITGITATTNAVNGIYTKIGNICTLQILVTLTGISSGTGNPYHSLPFTPVATNISVSKNGAVPNINTIISGLAYMGLYGANAQLYANTSSGGYINYTNWSDGELSYTLTYRTV